MNENEEPKRSGTIEPHKERSMAGTATGNTLPSHSIVAKNFAEDSENKIHSKETAALYGFKGGLVPGVGVYAYMTIPAVEAWGRPWLEGGRMTGSFLKPVYDGETVTVEAELFAEDTPRIVMRVVNEDGVVCGSGEALFPGTPPVYEGRTYAARSLPDTEARLEPSVEALPQDLDFGSLDMEMDARKMEEEFVRDMVDPLPIYRGEAAAPHPAFATAQANWVLAQNVNLGPWIHTKSEVQHYALPQNGETMSMRGRVSDSFEKKGHAFVVMDLVQYGRNDRVFTHVTHTAIVRPRVPA